MVHFQKDSPQTKIIEQVHRQGIPQSSSTTIKGNTSWLQLPGHQSTMLLHLYFLKIIFSMEYIKVYIFSFMFLFFFTVAIYINIYFFNKIKCFLSRLIYNNIDLHISHNNHIRFDNNDHWWIDIDTFRLVWWLWWCSRVHSTALHNCLDSSIVYLWCSNRMWATSPNNTNVDMTHLVWESQNCCWETVCLCWRCRWLPISLSFHVAPPLYVMPL